MDDMVVLVKTEGEGTEVSVVLKRKCFEKYRYIKITPKAFDKVERFLMPQSRYKSNAFGKHGLDTLLVHDALISKMIACEI